MTREIGTPRAPHPAHTAQSPVTVIVNADDFGMNQSETQATSEGMAAGHINSATVMANGRALQDAMRQIRVLSGVSFGVHLNLTQGAPISAGAGARLLVNQEGRMTRPTFQAFRPTPAILSAIYAEWCAQVELLASRGIEISHLDSHNHVHTVPFLFPVLKAVQKRFGIRKVRLSKNIYSAGEPCGPLLRMKKNGYNLALRSIYKTTTTGGFTDLITFCDVASRRTLGYQSVEIMVHPGSKGSEAEDALLCSRWEETLRFPVVKIHYGQL
jgi:predicted glycoside hydrolase/deacetylase ChbG (UPF0249 family)